MTDFPNFPKSVINYCVRPLANVPQEKLDNGYYKASDVWGTTFFRLAKNKDRFEVKCFADKRVRRTYTKVPVAALPNVYHVVVNFAEGETFRLVDDEEAKYLRIVGIHEPVKHVETAKHSGVKYYTQSFLVYTSDGVPTIAPVRATGFSGGLVLRDKEGLFFNPMNSPMFSRYPVWFEQADKHIRTSIEEGTLPLVWVDAMTEDTDVVML